MSRDREATLQRLREHVLREFAVLKVDPRSETAKHMLGSAWPLLFGDGADQAHRRHGEWT